MLSISILRVSFRLVFRHPLFPLPGMSSCNILLAGSFLILCPYHITRLSGFLVVCAAIFDSQFNSRLILHTSIALSSQSYLSWLLALSSCPSICPVQHCWPDYCCNDRPLQLHWHLPVAQHSTAFHPTLTYALFLLELSSSPALQHNRIYIYIYSSFTEQTKTE